MSKIHAKFRLHPVVWCHVVIKQMRRVYDSDVENPHTEPTLLIKKRSGIEAWYAYILIDGVFLKISVHFIGKVVTKTVRLISFWDNTAKSSVLRVAYEHSRGEMV